MTIFVVGNAVWESADLSLWQHCRCADNDTAGNDAVDHHLQAAEQQVSQADVAEMVIKTLHKTIKPTLLLLRFVLICADHCTLRSTNTISFEAAILRMIKLLANAVYVCQTGVIMLNAQCKICHNARLHLSNTVVTVIF